MNPPQQGIKTAEAPVIALPCEAILSKDRRWRHIMDADKLYVACDVHPKKAEVVVNALNNYASIEQENQRLREALSDCQDFLQAIVEATAIGRITEHSILRPGEKVKTTAHKLNQKAQQALATDTKGGG